jgi:hypothetical protein
MDADKTDQPDYPVYIDDTCHIDGPTSRRLEDACRLSRIPPETLPNLMNHKKAGPMLRGIAAEYMVFNLLNKRGIPCRKDEAKDVDLYITLADRIFRAEVKLAMGKSFRIKKTGAHLKVKAMRSRTSGKKKSHERAAKLGIEPKLCEMHNDQYRPSDFDIVLVDIENAYIDLTLNAPAMKFLTNTGVGCQKDYRLYWAWAKDLASSTNNPCCTRTDCDKNCGFIPNYPLIHFKPGSSKPELPWKQVFPYSPSKV